jgi:hypothetical protein
VYKAELTFPGKILLELNNVRFIDLFGFGEPSPLINMKYTRFVSEETIDAVVYVFPDRSVTADFNRLFDIPNFLEDIVARKRLFIVLNKADAYTDVSSGQWNRVAETFRADLVRHIPILRKFAANIPIFVLSAASIYGSIAHRAAKTIGDESLASLQRLRGQLSSLSNELEHSSSDPSLYLGAIFDLLGSLDLFAHGAEESLKRIEMRLPEIARLLDNISANEVAFERSKTGILEAFRAALQKEVEGHLQSIDYENVVKLDIDGLDIGDPRSLFRWMVDTCQKSAVSVYDHSLAKIFTAISVFVDDRVLSAYREYVSMLDDRIQAEFAVLLADRQKGLKSLSTTVAQSARDLLRFSQASGVHHTNRELLKRFANWFLRNRGDLNAERGQTIAEIKNQVLDNVQRTVETFIKVFVCGDSRLTPSFLNHICTAGERTYWEHIKNHIAQLYRGA